MEDLNGTRPSGGWTRDTPLRLATPPKRNQLSVLDGRRKPIPRFLLLTFARRHRYDLSRLELYHRHHG